MSALSRYAAAAVLVASLVSVSFADAATKSAPKPRKKSRPVVAPLDLPSGEMSFVQDGKSLPWKADVQWEKFKTPKGHGLIGPYARIKFVLSAPSAAVSAEKSEKADTADDDEFETDEKPTAAPARAAAPATMAGNAPSVLAESLTYTFANGTLISASAKLIEARIGAMNDVLTPSVGAPIEMKLILRSSRIDLGRCQQMGIQIERVGAPAKTPYYLTFGCARQANRILIGFTHPLDLEAFSSSVVESEGKGEPFKFFELTNSTNVNKAGELLRFEFRIAGESQVFHAVDLQTVGKKDAKVDEPPLVYTLGAGIAQFSANVPGARSQNSLQPLVSADFSTAPFWGHFVAQAAAALSPNVKLAGDEGSYQEFEIGFGYRFGGAAAGQAFYVQASLEGVAIHQELTKIAVAAQHAQPGLSIKIGNKGSLDPAGFAFSLIASGADASSSHLGVDGRYAFQAGRYSLGAGLGYAQQTQTTVNGNYQLSRLLGQMFIFL